MNSVDQKDGTRRRILQAAYELIVSSGSGQVATAEVRESAGVSRTTLYRYFPTREALIEGVIVYIADEVERQLKATIAARPQLRDRLDIVIELMIARQERDIGRRLLRVDPGFVMKMLDRTLQRLIDIFNDALADVYANAAEMTGAPVQGAVIGNLITRLFASMMLLPSPPLPPGQQAQLLRSVFLSLVFGLPHSGASSAHDSNGR